MPEREPELIVSRWPKSTHVPGWDSQRGTFSARILRALGSIQMTVVVVVVFALQASWVAVSARSDIYDEPYHLAAIKAFSTRWTPFIHQTAADGPLGDI